MGFEQISLLKNVSIVLFVLSAVLFAAAVMLFWNTRGITEKIKNRKKQKAAVTKQKKGAATTAELTAKKMKMSAGQDPPTVYLKKAPPESFRITKKIVLSERSLP